MAVSTERSTAWHWNVARLGVRLFAVVVAIAAAWDSLPAFFMTLAAIMVVLALAALFQSLRTAFGDSSAATGLNVSLPERAALLDEKNALLRAIKDIAYEHAVGKLSDADFQRLDRAYRHRAKEVLRELDEDLAPFLERAELVVARELEPDAAPERKPGKKAKTKAKRKKSEKERSKTVARIECPSCGTSNAPDALHCKECGGPVAPVECSACGATNDADARFCKKCAAPLEPGSAEVDASAEEAASSEGAHEAAEAPSRDERDVEAEDSEDARGESR